jgi:competence protein ComEA
VREVWLVVLGLVIGLLAAGGILLAAGRPRGQPISLSTPLPAPAIQVHVAGAVANPGIYALPADGRVAEAIQAAGGLSPAADSQAINLAAHLQDGDRLLVPALSPTLPPAAASEAPSRSGSQIVLPTQTSPGIILPDVGKIDINRATQAELESLPGIGPVTAQKIIDYRQTHGPFKDIEEIMDVKGIGPATFEKIKDLITVGSPP